MRILVVIVLLASACSRSPQRALLAPIRVNARAHVAIAREGTVVMYELTAAGTRELGTTRVDRVHAMAWASAGAPIQVLRDEERGEIVRDRYSPRASGDFVRLRVASGGRVWIDRCLRRGEDEEGCVRHEYAELGGRTRAEALPPHADLQEAPAPREPRLRPYTAEAGGRTQHLLECRADRSYPILRADDQVLAPASVRWLASEPPVALLRIEYAGSGEGDPSLDQTRPRLLRRCTLDAQDAQVRLGPDGLWAERVVREGAPMWIVFRAGTVVAELRGEDLVFAGGEASGAR